MRLLELFRNFLIRELRNSSLKVKMLWYRLSLSEQSIPWCACENDTRKSLWTLAPRCASWYPFLNCRTSWLWAKSNVERQRDSRGWVPHNEILFSLRRTKPRDKQQFVTTTTWLLDSLAQTSKVVSPAIAVMNPRQHHHILPCFYGCRLFMI